MRRIFFILTILLMPFLSKAQQITFSEPYQEDIQDLNFNILGKIGGQLLIFKDVRWHYATNIYDDSMRLKEKVDMDFLPGKVFNVDCVPYPDFFYIIYQFQKKSILYCMAAKIGADGKKIGQEIELDTTHIGVMGDNKIYSTVYSDDKKKIIVFKIQNKDNQANFLVKHYDNQLQLQHQSRLSMPFDDRHHSFGDFFADNSGHFVFSITGRIGTRDNPSELSLVTKAPEADTFEIKKAPIKDTYLDEVKLKVDNINKRYILNSFYYTDRNGDIDGLYSFIWDAAGDSAYASVYKEFDEELKSVAKSSGSNRTAFNDFFIRNIILKKDGSYIITAEDQSTQSTGSNNWNRYDYLYGSPYYSPFSNSYNYYTYSPYGYYRPFGTFGSQGIRYYSDNILVISLTQKGAPEWTNIIHKQQFADDNDNYLSFSTFNTSGEVHFIFNDISKRDKQLLDNILTADGSTKRNPSLRTYERGYEFMPRYAKQVGARQVIVPCTYRGRICFAKVDF